MRMWPGCVKIWCDARARNSRKGFGFQIAGTLKMIQKAILPVEGGAQASLAQLAEHALRKRTVVGSIPTGGYDSITHIARDPRSLQLCQRWRAVLLASVIDFWRPLHARAGPRRNSSHGSVGSGSPSPRRQGSGFRLRSNALWRTARRFALHLAALSCTSNPKQVAAGARDNVNPACYSMSSCGLMDKAPPS